MTAPSRITWADLPLEVIDQILRYCDNSSLLVLGQTDHQLNLSALSRYLTQHIVGDRIQLPCTFYLGKIPLDCGEGDEVIRSLSAALWLPMIIQHIDYHIAPYAKYGRYITHLRELTVFIQRMPKLISLRVHSGFIADGGSVNERSHHDVWDGLFAAAISRGCEVLEVRERGVLFPKRPFSPSRLSGRLYASICSRGLTTKPTVIPPYPHSSSPRTQQITTVTRQVLREVQIDGSTFRNSPLLLHMILTQHTLSITRLSFMNLNVRPSKKLKKMFDHIQFTNLKTFTFSNAWPVSPMIFLRFLSRHSTLTDLNLDSDIRRRYIQSPQKWTLWRSPPTFPNLQHLEMFPEALHWLVPDFRRCPNLHSIVLKGDLWSFGDALKARTLPDVIKSILGDLHSVPSMTWALKVEIAFPLENSDWLSNLYSAGDSKTRFRWWRVKDIKVKDLRIRFNYQPQLDVLVNWLSTFPSLEHLEVDPAIYALRREFVELVAAKCPNFRSFGLPYHHTSYAGAGQERKMWVVQGGRARSHTIRRSG